MLRKFLLTGILFTLLHVSAFSQKFNLSIYAGAGGTHFKGNGVATHTNIPKGPPYYNTVDDPYGYWGRTSWFGGVSAQWRLPNNWILSASSQIEYFGTRVSFGTVILQPGLFDTMGAYMKDLYFISVNPEIGKILWERKTTFRLHAGIDYAFYITGEDEAAFYRPTLVSYGYQSVPGKNDVRLTAGASFTWRKWTLAATYKYGLTNYRNDDNRQVYSRLLQWKLMYSVWRKPGKNDTGRK